MTVGRSLYPPAPGRNPPGATKELALEWEALAGALPRVDGATVSDTGLDHVALFEPARLGGAAGHQSAHHALLVDLDAQLAA